jgi:hypothetical protein
VQELERQYNVAIKDPEFIAEVDRYRREYIGGPTPTYFAKNLTEKMGGAQVLLRGWPVAPCAGAASVSLRGWPVAPCAGAASGVRRFFLLYLFYLPTRGA